MPRGYFGIGICGGKTPENLGTLWRTASLYDAAFVFTVGKRYPGQSSDTAHTPLHTPLMHFDDIDSLKKHLPWSCPLIGVELDPRAHELSNYHHLDRAVYLLGAEDHGLTMRQRDMCHQLVQIESLNPWSMNVAVAGSIVLHSRHVQRMSSIHQEVSVS
jgi:tRNA G18 (ribose-2'-O)-methylase SpoU